MNLKPQLVMVRRDLLNLNIPDLPRGYSLRTFQAGDSIHWERIIADSFQREEGQIPFDKIMRSAPAFQPKRIFFITHSQTPVATASAWHRKQDGPQIGYLHYVGCINDHQGMGLGRVVSIAALLRMKIEGRQQAMLETDDFRLPAIRSYLKMGFVPRIVHNNQQERWKSIYDQMPQHFEQHPP